MTTIIRRGAGRLACLALAAAAVFTMFAPPAAFAQQEATVRIKDFMFEPMSLTVHRGTTVIWKNLDGEPHVVVSVDGLFRSPGLDQDDTYRHRFDKTGTYKIVCGIHPTMRATIVVR
jgi:plastocyanin